MPSLRSIAAASAALLLTAPAFGQALDAESLSISEPETAPPGVTLLEPEWLLPPIESLDTTRPIDDHLSRVDETVHADADPADPSDGGPLSYSVSKRLTAQLSYRHSEPFDRAASRPLREDSSTAVSTGPDRDVLDLNMWWNLAGSSVGLGYQLQSARGDSLGSTVGISRFLPGSDQATHSLTLGLTRRWGAGRPPPPIEPALFIPEIDVAASETTPTPAP